MCACHPTCRILSLASLLCTAPRDRNLGVELSSIYRRWCVIALSGANDQVLLELGTEPDRPKKSTRLLQQDLPRLPLSSIASIESTRVRHDGACASKERECCRTALDRLPTRRSCLLQPTSSVVWSIPNVRWRAFAATSYSTTTSTSARSNTAKRAR